MKSKKDETNLSGPLQVVMLRRETATIYILGQSPLALNCMSNKAQGELLLPGGKKSAAMKATTLKHNPIEEYRNSVYRNRNEDCEARLIFPATAFKGAMATAALEVPGVTKAQVSRLVWVEQDYVDIFGIPQLIMQGVRSSNMERTPDIRTIAILPEWCCVLTISYIAPQMNKQSIANLLGNAGLIVGVGDGRQEKGKLSRGQFTVVGDNDEDFLAIRKHGGRVAQDRSLERPAFYDEQSERLFNWFNTELQRRGDTGKLKSAGIDGAATEGEPEVLNVKPNGSSRRKAAAASEARQ